MDEQGTKIHANVLQKWVPKFKSLLHEGAAILIKNPTIARHASKYKLIDNSKKLSLYYKTSVTNCRDFKGSMFGFSLVKFANVISKIIPEHTAIDVNGEVVACETMVSLPDNNGKLKRRMQIEMQDLEGIKIQDTLWDAFAQEFSDYVSNHKDNGVVILVIHFAMVKIYREKPFLSNSFNVTRLFINYEIDEIRDFKNRFRIPLRVQDDTGIVSSTLFDQEANKLTNDDNILNELEMRFAAQQPAEFESVNVHSTDFSSQKKLKDDVSCTGENATPSDVDKSTADSLKSQEKLYEKRLGKGIDRKRNFEGTYDADHEGKGLATKTLKIPKLEK
ncbi:uncharacterized protein LOC112506042 [Cynara cardunculus var. scolymus]|uniref:uncharacterized protein LOC112506042 n=1 Tax=Cynara cardunculus var. scolymus TaxID=59895 RepID=UPI000D62E6A5|nr:uncharacterized protein LOC112506042 [Cynara cardunculus var. scolymus]